MNILKVFTTLFLLSLFFTTSMTAQHRNCGADHNHSEYLLKNPEFAKDYEEHREFLRSKLSEANLSGMRAACATPKYIPVVIHYESGNIPNQCMIDAATAQIDQLNLDFNNCNANQALFCTWIDAGCTARGGTAGADAQPVDGSCLLFCLADQNLPAGQDNIGGFAITSGDFSSNNQNASNVWRGYFNVYVGAAGGALGFVNFIGGASNANTTQGASVLTSTFGAAGFNGCNGVGTNNTFGNGATLTHEAGHWFGLDHTFQETPNIADTPPQSNPNFGCPNPPVNLTTCNSNLGNDYSGNFMDYVDDDCMFMFTEDQMIIMRNTADQQNDWEVNSMSCYQVLPYTSCNPGPCGTAGPTCSDGIQNQGELGVDCGGPCPACPATCYTDLTNGNGLSNNETGTADYESSSFINTTANTTIQNGASVDYDGTTFVQLNPNFTVNGGAVFNAFINGCNNGNGGVNLTGNGTTNSLNQTDTDKATDNDTEVELNSKDGLGKTYIKTLKDNAIKQIEGMK